MSTPKEYPPDVISKSFIKQYYELMCTNPSELYRFYKDDSCFTHTEGYQIAEVINGTEKIRNFVRELDIAGARFNLADGSVDAHRGENNGVFVLVTGYVTPKGTDVVRQFVQSFFLAVQAENTAAYYVRNSVFRLFEPAAVPAASVSTGVNPSPPAVPEQTEAPVDIPAAVEPPAPREPKKHRGKKESPVAAPAPASAPAAAAEPPAGEESDMIMESVVVLIEDVTGERPNSTLAETIALQQIGEQLAELADEALGSKDADSGPKSYADLFKRGEAAAAAAPASAANAAAKKGRSTSGGRAARAEAAPAAAKPETAAAAPAKIVVSSSLFVKQLPADITEADLLSIFVGASKADINSKGFGFIEFPEPVFAASTMTRYQEDPSIFSHNGQRLKVEERTILPRAPGSKPAAQTRVGKDKPADKAEGAGKPQGKGGNAAPRKNVANGKTEKGWNVQGGSGNKK